jgi:hypothetical protein
MMRPASLSCTVLVQPVYPGIMLHSAGCRTYEGNHVCSLRFRSQCSSEAGTRDKHQLTNIRRTRPIVMRTLHQSGLSSLRLRQTCTLCTSGQLTTLINLARLCLGGQGGIREDFGDEKQWKLIHFSENEILAFLPCTESSWTVSPASIPCICRFEMSSVALVLAVVASVRTNGDL